MEYTFQNKWFEHKANHIINTIENCFGNKMSCNIKKFVFDIAKVMDQDQENDFLMLPKYRRILYKALIKGIINTTEYSIITAYFDLEEIEVE